MNLLLSFLIFILLISCKNNKSIPVTIINKLNNDQEIIIRDWQIIGPFPDNIYKKNSTTSFNRDDFKIFGLNEVKISPMLLENLSDKSLILPYTLADIFVNKTIYCEDKFIDISKILNQNIDDQNGNTYLACNILSKVEQEVVFLTGSDDGMKLWLNQELLFSFDGERENLKYNEYTRAHLKKGMNFLLIKSNYKGITWYFNLYLSNPVYAKKKYIRYKYFDFLENNIVDKDSILNINLNLFTQDTSFSIKILKNNNQILNKSFIACTNPKIPLKGLNDGIYSCRVIFPADTFDRKFFYGDIFKQFTILENEIKKFKKLDERTEISINALLFRYKHLFKHKEKFGINFDDLQNSEWQKKMVFIYDELCILSAKIKNNNETMCNIPGLHIRGFRSKRNGQLQHYAIFVPDECTKQKEQMPLVIEFPVGVVMPRPFLENYPLADHSRLERLKSIAEKYGFAVLWFGSRNFYNFPISLNSTIDFINEVKTDYNIDMNRVFSISACDGGRKSMQFAVDNPMTLSGIGIFQLEPHLPYEKLINISDIPLYVVHGELDKHIPIENTYYFRKEAVKSGLNLNFDVKEKSTTFLEAQESLISMFEFFINDIKKE